MIESQENRETKAKDIISYNIAITQASLNVFCMEANAAISKKKAETRHLYRRYLAGKAQMEYQFGDPSFDDKLWNARLDSALAKKKAEHDQRIKNMTDAYNKKKKQLKNELDITNQRIADYQSSINQSKSILINEIPNFDFSIVGNFGDIKRKIEEEKVAIQKLQQQKNMPPTNNPRNIREALLKTKPVYGINNR